MDALKKNNPRAYMNMVLRSKGSSIDQSSSSPTVSGGNNGPETVDQILKQLKARHWGANLFEALEKYFIYGYGIKASLKKLDVPDTPSEVVDFLVTFGPFFDHIIVDFQINHDVKTKMASKENERSKEWNLATESNQHAEKLEVKLFLENEVDVAFDAKILGCK